MRNAFPDCGKPMRGIWGMPLEESFNPACTQAVPQMSPCNV